ncbi:transglycosylase domain-containing protein [Melghirimyces algeriensis]|uniref:Penicillin-binding protein 2A n=1 Tax=Melghirimyces algeriensis TaxID=910412 RepID=A0A521DPC3_9BACL|nr:transglycosylase domain-containing protein [Melghirimyces algeriensis]SMO73587.1 penicillin-binding protein 2A [Melghirimyces algeriensis]
MNPRRASGTSPRSTGRRAGGRSLAGRSGGQRGNNGRNFLRFFNKKWFILVFMTTVLLVVGVFGFIILNAKKYNMEEIKESLDESSVILDRNGKKALPLGGDNREVVDLDDVKSPELMQAFLAVEDERFYEHNGVDYKGLARAVVKNIIALGKAEGASTITMQVSRNAVMKGRREKTYSRKLDEITVALNLEKDYSKKDILEVYLNYIDLGNNVKGIKMAAKIYFDKDITKEKLEPHEIALLAGLPKAPYGYDPFRHKEKALQRRNVVLNKMAEDTALPNDPIITEEEAEKYKKMPLGVKKEAVQKHLKNDKFYAYKNIVLDELKERYNITDLKQFANDGFKIQTSLDPKIQQAAEDALANEAFFVNKQTGAKMPADQLNAAMTFLDPKTGEIVAVGGGRGYRPTYLNWAQQGIQPGSTMKPITVFGPAVEEHGFNEYTPVKDAPIDINGYTPKNSSGRFYGDITLQEVVNKSLNASTIRILHEVVKKGPAAKYAEKAGIKLTDKDKQSLAALGLGGMTKGTTTTQMAQAYASFANVSTGENRDAHTIRKITNSAGEVVKPKTKIKKHKVFSKKTAWYMTRMLKNNVEQGTGTNAQIAGYDVAGKTGTTQNSKEAWFVGYTPRYVGAVTVFNMKGNAVNLSGGGYAAPIFKSVLSVALEGKAPQKFQNPGVEEPRPPFRLKPVQDLRGGYDPASQSVQLQWSDASDRLEYKVQRSENGQDWKEIGKTSEGTFTDDNIKKPEGGGWFGGGESRSYSYRVIAVDTEAQGGEPKESEPSNVVTVQVTSREEPPGDEGDEKPDHPNDKRGNGRHGKNKEDEENDIFGWW